MDGRLYKKVKDGKTPGVENGAVITDMLIADARSGSTSDDIAELVDGFKAEPAAGFN